MFKGADTMKRTEADSYYAVGHVAVAYYQFASDTDIVNRVVVIAIL